MDRREKRAQALHWEIHALRASGDATAAARKSRVMARLHEALARELLDAGNSKGWIHLQAAVTAWVKSGDSTGFHNGVALLAKGLERFSSSRPQDTGLLGKLSELLAWVNRHRHLAAPMAAHHNQHLNLSADEEISVRNLLELWATRDGISATARRCGLAPSTISRVLSGARPGLKLIAGMSNAEGVTVNQLLGREPLPSRTAEAARPARVARSSAA